MTKSTANINDINNGNNTTSPYNPALMTIDSDTDLGGLGKALGINIESDVQVEPADPVSIKTDTQQEQEENEDYNKLDTEELIQRHVEEQAKFYEEAKKLARSHLRDYMNGTEEDVLESLRLNQQNRPFNGLALFGLKELSVFLACKEVFLKRMITQYKDKIRGKILRHATLSLTYEQVIDLIKAIYSHKETAKNNKIAGARKAGIKRIALVKGKTIKN